MIARRVSKALVPVVFTAAIAAAQPAAVHAQVESPDRTPRQSTAGQSSAPAAVQTNRNAEETRREFYETLDKYPPSLGRVLRLDPSLLTNAAYLASYPNLAEFIGRNPDVPRNPDYYLERYQSQWSYNEPQDPRAASLRMWREALEFLGPFAVFCVVLFALFSLIKYVVEYRRWARVSKVNAEVHNKILDRFGSNEELLAYVDSPAGRRFLEATPIAPTPSASGSVNAPYARILLSVQVGVLLVALGFGFVLVSGRAIEEIQPILSSLAALAFCLGVGSIASAGASYLLSRKLGLLNEAAVTRPEHTV
jgi:hypothetical protein